MAERNFRVGPDRRVLGSNDRDSLDPETPLRSDTIGQKWTRADDEVLSALLTGATRTGAAEMAGVSERTVRRRLEDPAFRRRLADARAAIVAEVVARIAAEANTAFDTLMLLCREQPAKRFGAAPPAWSSTARKVGSMLSNASRLTSPETRSMSML